MSTIGSLQRQSNSKEAYDKLTSLGIPVNRFGYKHIDNKPNQAYRHGELECWGSALKGESDRLIRLTWKFSATLLQKPYNLLDNIKCY